MPIAGFTLAWNAGEGKIPGRVLRGKVKGGVPFLQKAKTGQAVLTHISEVGGNGRASLGRTAVGGCPRMSPPLLP